MNIIRRRVGAVCHDRLMSLPPRVYSTGGHYLYIHSAGGLIAVDRDVFVAKNGRWAILPSSSPWSHKYP